MTKVVQTVDNFDNSIRAVTTETFVFRGVAYTVDLCQDNADMLEADFGKYIAVAERLGPARVVVNDEEVIKPKGKAPKAKRASEPKPPPVADQDTAGQLELGAGPAPAEPPDDEFPPEKSWLRMAKNEHGGPGSSAVRARGVQYRQAMRNWLRHHGYPDLGPRGVIPEKGIDAYWDHVVRIRAERAAGLA